MYFYRSGEVGAEKERPEKTRAGTNVCLMVACMACIASSVLGLIWTDSVAALSVRWRPASAGGVVARTVRTALTPTKTVNQRTEVETKKVWRQEDIIFYMYVQDMCRCLE